MGNKKVSDKIMIYEPTDNFYVQKMHLTTVREWRFKFFANMCHSKKVMHIGCADAMAFKVDSNLHIYLSNPDVHATMHGLDIDIEATNTLAEVCPGTYFTSYDAVKEEYDLVLVPEVMEHVPDVYSFLKNVFSISSKEYMITVPNMSVAHIFCDDSYALEIDRKSVV